MSPIPLPQRCHVGAIAYLWSMSIARAAHTHALVSSRWSRGRSHACAESCLLLHRGAGACRYGPAWRGALCVRACVRVLFCGLRGPSPQLRGDAGILCVCCNGDSLGRAFGEARFCARAQVYDGPSSGDTGLRCASHTSMMSTGIYETPMLLASYPHPTICR